MIFQNLIKTSEEIIFLSKRKLLRVKSKKSVENSNKPSSSSSSSTAQPHISPEEDSRCDSPDYESSRHSPAAEPEAGRVPVTFSWPSLEVEVEGQEVVSVHTQEESRDPRLDQDPATTVVAASLKNNFNRISSACDSGYSELDLSSTAAQESQTMNVVREESINNCDKSYLDEFQLYFNLDKMLDRTSHEENCFKELDLSLSYSEETEEVCSCPVSPAESTALPLSPSDNSLTNRPTVISIAQGFSTTTPPTTNIHRHHQNVSKKYLSSLPGKRSIKPRRVIRRDSSQSLPVVSAPTESLFNDLRRLSLPKVTADVVLVEQTEKSREIFI